MSLKVTDTSGRSLAEEDIDFSKFAKNHQWLAATEPLTLCLGLDQTTQDSPSLFPASRTLIHADITRLPTHWLGYDAVRRIFLATQDLPALASLQADQIQALHDWVQMGGHLVIMSGEHAEQFSADKPLSIFAPGPFQAVKRTMETGPLELSIRANTPLVKTGMPPLTYSVFEVPRHHVLYTNDEQPALIRQGFGFGTLSFIPFDLNAEPFTSWDATNKILQAALLGETMVEDQRVSTARGKISHDGYEDFSGQLRAGMDRYQSVHVITFTSVALLIGLFILLIGPGDYFFLNKLCKRMELTWITFPLVTLLFCGIAFWIADRIKSKDVEANQLEVIDIDTESAIARGTWWTNIYSPHVATYDFQGTGENPLVGQLQEQWCFWQGLPGQGLGGMRSANDLGTHRAPYDCQLTSLETPPNLWNGASLTGTPIQAGATKLLTGRWKQPLSISFQSELRKNNATDALQGTFTNPFPVEITDCVLLFGTWAYLLERPLGPGETIDVDTEMREKTVKGFFTRRQDNDSEVNIVWDTTNQRWRSIIHLMMFYDAIGGKPYTQLTHRYQGYLDASAQLQVGKAVLVGKIKSSDAATPLKINGTALSDVINRQETYIRIQFPVQPRSIDWQRK